MTTSQQPGLDSETTLAPTTFPITVPPQRDPAEEPGTSPPAGLVARRRVVPWVVGIVIAILVAAVVALAAALASTNGAAQPVSPAAPAPTVPSVVPTPPAVKAPPVVTVPAAPPRAVLSREWQQIAKNPNAHVGESLIVYGHVTQFDSATGTQGFRANVDGVSHRQWYDYKTNTVLSGDQAVLSELVQGDLFRAEVVVSGSYTYTTTMGGSMTAPMLAVTAVKVTGSGG